MFFFIEGSIAVRQGSRQLLGFIQTFNTETIVKLIFILSYSVSLRVFEERILAQNVMNCVLEHRNNHVSHE